FGPVNSDGGISQILATSPGQNYTLSFYLQNAGAPLPSDDHLDKFSVSFDGVTLTSLLNANTFGYTLFSFNVTASSAATPLTFSFRHDPSYFYLDDVSVIATPLPAALPLFASGLGLLGFLGWRKKRKTMNGCGT